MEPIEVGIINNTHGIKGELKATAWCDNSSDLLQIKKITIDNMEYNVIKLRVNKDKILLQIENIDTIEKASCFKNKIICADKSLFPLDESRYFVSDLIGIQVSDVDSSFIYGTLEDIIVTGANDVYSVKSKEGKEYLIPAIKQCIIKVDLDQKIMLIRPLEGLFD